MEKAIQVTEEIRSQLPGSSKEGNNNNNNNNVYRTCFFFNLFYLFIYLFLAALGLRCCAWAFL